MVSEYMYYFVVNSIYSYGGSLTLCNNDKEYQYYWYENINMELCQNGIFKNKSKEIYKKVGI